MAIRTCPHCKGKGGFDTDIYGEPAFETCNECDHTGKQHKEIDAKGESTWVAGEKP